MRFFFLLVCAFSLLQANPLLSPPSFSLEQEEPSLVIHNALLAKIQDKPITVFDVVKRLDMQFYRIYPELKDKTMARYQFYKNSWKAVLQDLIHTELILLDASKKEVKLPDGEIREEFENRFGPNSRKTLEKLKLDYEEAWDITRKELLVQKMLGFFVHYKAQQKVTPEGIWNAYQAHLEKNPSSEEFLYRVVTVKAGSKEEAKKLAEETALSLVNYTSDLDSSKVSLDELKKAYKESSVQVSSLFTQKKEDLSSSFFSALAPLKEKEFSPPIEFSQKGSSFFRLFYLQEKKETQGASFEALSSSLREEVFQKKAEEASQVYLEKLKKIYKHNIQTYLSENFEPFSLQ